MSQSVMIKSNKYGINLVLDPNIPFVELLKDVIEKFKASEKFFKNAELAISFEESFRKRKKTVLSRQSQRIRRFRFYASYKMAVNRKQS